MSRGPCAPFFSFKDPEAISEDRGSPPPRYHDVIQVSEEEEDEAATTSEDIPDGAEKVGDVKKGCRYRTLTVFKAILVLMLIATFGFVVLASVRLVSIQGAMEREINSRDKMFNTESKIYVRINDIERTLEGNEKTLRDRDSEILMRICGIEGEVVKIGKTHHTTTTTSTTLRPWTWPWEENTRSSSREITWGLNCNLVHNKLPIPSTSINFHEMAGI